PVNARLMQGENAPDDIVGSHLPVEIAGRLCFGGQQIAVAHQPLNVEIGPIGKPDGEAGAQGSQLPLPALATARLAVPHQR
ncbi:hypothetical protein, partial [Escherichia coli]|uniref:hypothetical protein n=1 Tax=Escherichia coli TaxID=562 RepID=UPI0013D877C8